MQRRNRAGIAKSLQYGSATSSPDISANSEPSSVPLYRYKFQLILVHYKSLTVSFDRS